MFFRYINNSDWVDTTILCITYRFEVWNWYLDLSHCSAAGGIHLTVRGPSAELPIHRTGLLKYDHKCVIF